MGLGASEWISLRGKAALGALAYFRGIFTSSCKLNCFIPQLHHWLVVLVWPLELTIALGFWGLPPNGQQRGLGGVANSAEAEGTG